MKYIKNKKKIKALTVSIILALQTNTFAIAAETVITPDSSNHKNPMVDKAANGTIVVNIRTPNETGLSHNQYKDLQVGNDGIIFNNAREISKTELAGYINGNQYLGSQGADIILNEVTGRNITNLNGFIEVAGKRADVIIANPNGIVGNNFGYINTGRAVLTTGNPQIDATGRLAGFNVNNGEITIEGKGLDATKTSSMEIYAQAVKINAKIAAQKLKTVGGKNKIDGNGNVIEVTDNEYTGVALDVGVLGSMYANSIYLVGTTKGLGVNMEGEVYANDGDFILTSDGNIKLKSTISATANTKINAGESIENTGTVYGTNIDIKANTLNNNGGETAPVIAARENISIEAAVVNNKDNALVLGINDVKIKASEINNYSATIEAGQNMQFDTKKLNNNNIHYEVENALVTGEENIYEVQLDGSNVRYKEGDYKIRHSGIADPDTQSVGDYDIFYRKDDWDGEDKNYNLVTPGGVSSRWHEYDYHRVIKDDVIKTTAPAKITAGGKIKITADEITNDKSEIIAGKELTIDADIMNNIDGMGTRIITDTGRAGEFHTADAGSRWDHYMVTEQNWGEYNKESRTDIIVQPATAVVKAEPADEHGNKITYTFAVSNSQLYITAASDATYYIETNPAFADKKQWLSSDYFFNQMQYDPDKISKKISDGYYEQQIVKDKLINLTGKYYIEDYASMEEQYKAFLDNAVEFAKNNTVKIGAALTKEQQKKLKTPIVWMVEESVLLPNGEIVTALVPEIYLPKNAVKKQGTTVISAKEIDIQTTQDILNKGNIIAGDITKLSANNINNIGGRITGADVLLAAQKDVNNIGSTILAENGLTIQAGNDINFETTTATGKTTQGTTTNISSIAGAYVTNENGSLNLEAGNDINLKAAQIITNGNAELTAGNDINLRTKEISDSNNMTFGSNAYRKDNMQKDIGTAIASGKDAIIKAGQNINAKAADINANEKLGVEAGNDINITAGKEQTYVEEFSQQTWNTVLSSKTTTHHSIRNEQNATSSNLSGNEITMQAGNSLNIEGSNITGTKDINLKAENDVKITSVTETLKETNNDKTEKSGIFGSGIGFTIGTKTVEDNTDSALKSQHGSIVGSTEGNINITSEKEINIKASDIIAKKDISLTGENVNISAANENYDYKYTHKEEQSGLTVSLGGGAAGQIIENIINPIEKAATAQDEKLKALSAIKAASHIHEIPKSIEKIKSGTQAITNLNIGIGHSETETTIESNTVTAHESTITAGENVNITATQKDINIKGSEISGENINLQAKENINITAAGQSNITNTETNNSSSFAGVSVGIGTGTIGIAVNASKGEETIDENSTSYKKSTVTASDKLHITSGEDTNIIGSQISGKKVKADIGENLNIESLQETNKYKADSKSGGIGINTALGGNISSDISLTGSIEKTDSDYKSVSEQAGIYAGKEGYDISVENNTDLKGAVITSEAEANKNSLTTGTLTYSDIENKAEYESKGIGISLDANKTSGNQPATEGQKGLIPSVPAKISDKAESTTKSAVAEGKITITKPEEQKQDVNKLNRNTKETLNKLDNIFDINKIRETQETAALFGELAANGIHVIAEKNGWKEGSPEKTALHAAVGAVIADITNGNIAAGAITGGTTEYLTKAILKASKGDKAQAQWLALIVGAALSKATGGNEQLGAYIAVNAVRNNLGNRIDISSEIEADVNNDSIYVNCSEEEKNKIIEGRIALYEAEYDTNSLDKVSKEAILDMARIMVNKGIVSGPETIKNDYRFFNITFNTSKIDIGSGAIIDKEGNVYVFGEAGKGAGMTLPITFSSGEGKIVSEYREIVDAIDGGSTGVGAAAVVGTGISVGDNGIVTVEVAFQTTQGIAVMRRRAYHVGKLAD